MAKAASASRNYRRRRASAPAGDVPEYTIHDSLTLPIATNAQEEIVGAALSILRAKYPKPMADSRPDCPDMSFHFKKAGVILWQISADHPRQQDLFDSIDRSKQKKLMEAIDAINRKNGYGTIRQAIQGTNSRWMRAAPSAGSFHGTRTSPLSG